MGKDQKYRILQELKSSEGLAAGEIAERLGLSYMGVKQYLHQLQKGGYIDAWRRPPTGVGRPEKAYRLTERAQQFFPTATNRFTQTLLESCDALFGPGAADKILFRIFHQRIVEWRSMLRDLPWDDRVRRLARLRDNDGCMTELIVPEGTSERVVVEHNAPLDALSRTYPVIGRLETELYASVLHADVTRTELRPGGGLYQCRFRLAPRDSTMFHSSVTHN